MTERVVEPLVVSETLELSGLSSSGCTVHLFQKVLPCVQKNSMSSFIMLTCGVLRALRRRR
jgi:hypothetical protein